MRSDNLQGLTGPDVSRLVDDLGVRVVVDLRTGEEVELEGPGPLVDDGRVDIRHRSLYPEKGRLTDVIISRDEGESLATQYYLSYLADRPDSSSALHDVAAAPGRCSCTARAGKDRTGVVVAMALAAVGVERAAIVEDLRRARASGSPRSWRACAPPRPTRPTSTGVSDDSRKPRAGVDGARPRRCSTSATAGPRAGSAVTASTPSRCAPAWRRSSLGRRPERSTIVVSVSLAPARLRSVRNSASSSAVSRQATRS
jgi:hypothetical protein